MTDTPTPQPDLSDEALREMVNDQESLNRDTVAGLWISRYLFGILRSVRDQARVAELKRVRDSILRAGRIAVTKDHVYHFGLSIAEQILARRIKRLQK